MADLALGKAATRQLAVSEMKRRLILDAARKVFEAEGLEGASVRAIAAEAGYTAAALYFHFESKETIYAELLEDSLARLRDTVEEAGAYAGDAENRLKAAAMGFFSFYAENPRELDLGFYLFRGGMRPKGLGSDRDKQLNAMLEAALSPVTRAAVEICADPAEAKTVTAEIFAHAAGLLLLAHTGRIRMFGASASALMERYLDRQLALFVRS